MMRNAEAEKYRVTRSRLCGVMVPLGMILLSSALAACGESAPVAANGSGGILNVPASSAVPPVEHALPFVAFTEKPPASVATTHCSLDAISWQPVGAAVVVDHHARVEFQGWAADDLLGVPGQVSIVLANGNAAWIVQGAGGLTRQDVAAARKNPAFLRSGYAVDADLENVVQDEYRIALIAHFGGGDRYCDLGKIVAVK